MSSDSAQACWVFGYGSLIYKADFPFLERQPAAIEGWKRRFWQGSHDHRGSPEAPGRVVTLITAPGERCRGVAYRIETPVFAHLDHREKNGYERVRLPLAFDDGRCIQGTTYIATPHNEAFLGPADVRSIAAHILASCGPSGTNLEYFERLLGALAALGDLDGHLLGIQREIERLRQR